MGEARANGIASYKNLDVWIRSRLLVKQVYIATKVFPREEVFGITSQIRRAAVSIPTNLAEGAGRRTKGEYLNHVGIARGSAYEVQSLIDLATMLEYLDDTTAQSLNDLVLQTIQMLSGLMRSLEASRN